jgi:RimJ/RimL family protein N-acetyltransferase
LNTSQQIAALEFRALELGDLPLLHRWLNAEPVLRWYAKQPMTLQQVSDKYAPRVSGANHPVRVRIALVNGKASGLFQFYPAAVFPEYAAAIGAEPGWYVTDFFLGEASARGLGFAPRLLRAFEALVREAAPDYTALVAGPHPGNEASIRTLRHAGYEFKREAMVGLGQREYIMVRERCAAAT